MEKLTYHKRIRLHKEIYSIEDHPCSITICVQDRKQIFTNKKLTQGFISVLRESSEKYEVPLYAYCIMPDHVHLLMSSSKDKDIISFIRELKSISTRL